MIPSLAAAAFLFVCCVLPFHHVMHEVMPACHTAMQDESPASSPAKEKQEPVKRVLSDPPQTQRIALADDATTRIAAPTASSAYRSFIALGAIRCDRDVGLHVLDDTFRI